MLLTGLNIIHYLLDRGMVDLKSCVNGDFLVCENSSRNFNFMVMRDVGDNYLVKQAKAWNPDQVESVRVEAFCYRLANNDQRFNTIQAFLPKFYSFDFFHNILITGLLKDAEDLFQYYMKHETFDARMGEEIARALLAYHRIPFTKIPKEPGFSVFKSRIPWVFTFSQMPLSHWENMIQDTAGKQAMQLIYQIPEFIERIKEAAQLWGKTAFVHGDLRFNNFLINKYSSREDPLDLKLIDWELADQGDPLWDVASIIQNYLNIWLFRESQDKPLDLEAFKPSVANFWETYRSGMQWSNLESREQWRKCIRYAALRLINSCFESTPHISNIQPYNAKVLQLSLNLLKWPENAGRSLFGLEY